MRAVASPIPEEAPVTSATLPFRLSRLMPAIISSRTAGAHRRPGAASGRPPAISSEAFFGRGRPPERCWVIGPSKTPDVKPDLNHFRHLRAPAYVRPLGPLAYRIPRRVGDEVYGLRTHTDDRYRPGRRLELEVL